MASDSERSGGGAKIKTIVFDLGGVLFTEGKSAALEVLSRDYGYDPAVVMEVLTCLRSRDMRKGLITEGAFWSWVASWIPDNYDTRVIKDNWYEGYTLDRDVFELIQSLKARYRLAVFSGNIPDRVAYLDKKYRFRELFDVEVYSYDHQADKGEPRFLEALLATLDAPPGEILYIDDSEAALELAERRGVNVVLYTTGQIARIEAAMSRLGITV